MLAEADATVNNMACLCHIFWLAVKLIYPCQPGLCIVKLSVDPTHLMLPTPHLPPMPLMHTAGCRGTRRRRFSGRWLLRNRPRAGSGAVSM